MRILRAPILLFILVFSSNALADLAVYDVEAKYRQEVFAALRGILTPERSDVIGQIQMLPSGQILIDTSPQMHEQIAAVIRAIDERQSEAAPRVTLRYWAVIGSRAANAESETPDMLSNVLDELKRIHGDLSFRVLGNATLVTESGQQGELDGEPLSVRQEAYVEGETLNTDLEITFLYRAMSGQFQANANVQVNSFQTIQANEQRVELNTSMRQGEFVVVGENTIRQNTISHGELDGTIFYIVHWSDTQ
jgi:hypothetical protein